MTTPTFSPDEWYNNYDEASVKQRYQMLLDILAQPLSQDFLEETEIDQLLISMSDELSSNNLIDEYLALIQLVQQQQPKLYKKEFVYYDKFLIAYYIYTKQNNLLEEALIRFKKYPAKDIDYFLSVLDLLSFYDQSEIAVDLCQKTYNSVKNNSNIINGVEDELSWLIVTHSMEHFFDKHQQKEEINWSQFKQELHKYGYGKDTEWLEDVKYALTHEFDQEQFFSQFEQKKLHSRAFNSLSIAFYIYMKQEKQMSFVCSQAIWEAIFEFLGERELNVKQQANPNTFFTFSEKSLESYLTQKVYGFLSTRQAQGFAALWGIPYLYDFLVSQEIIREQIHRKVINITNQLKADVLKSYQNSWELWRYDFINRWQPDSNSEKSKLAEQLQLFNDSFNNSEPLSDTPGEGKLESFFTEMAEKMGIDFDKLKQDSENSDELPSQESEPKETAKQLTSKPIKPKKKKSNLGLAAQLYKKK